MSAMNQRTASRWVGTQLITHICMLLISAIIISKRSLPLVGEGDLWVIGCPER